MPPTWKDVEIWAHQAKKAHEYFLEATRNDHRMQQYAGYDGDNPFPKLKSLGKQTREQRIGSSRANLQRIDEYYRGKKGYYDGLAKANGVSFDQGRRDPNANQDSLRKYHNENQRSLEMWAVVEDANEKARRAEKVRLCFFTGEESADGLLKAGM